MRPSGLALLVASSLLLSAAQAATRPHYGGTLRVAMAAAPASLDPLELNQSGSLAGRNLSRLLFDTLVSLDDRGRPLPALAISWQADPGNQRWQFQLRRGVTFQDGSAVTAEQVASSLRVANPSWRVLATGDTVVIERDSPAPELAPELALARNGITKRDGAKLFGTGPFAVAAWEPGKKLRLAASNEYWGGRPFLDSVEIDMGQGLREQMLALDLGRADLIEVAPEQAHRAAAEGRRVESSLPVDLMALVFAREAQSTDDTRLRQALSYSIDRQALNSVLLQRGGEPAGALLPNWMTGYAFLFSTSTDLAKANQVRGPLRQASPWTLSYDAGDPLARVLAERIALNARDAGLQLQLTSSAAADLRLVRTPIRSLDRRVALTTLEAAIGVGRSNLSADSTEDFYSAERLVLESRRVIPLLHARVSFGLSGGVRNWTEGPGGSWRLADVWLGAGQP
jgi:peptide/nickel transport system substrate-binding protein